MSCYHIAEAVRVDRIPLESLQSESEVIGGSGAEPWRKPALKGWAEEEESKRPQRV